jgi:C_GCAxxG_C_C family probable redox protein
VRSKELFLRIISFMPINHKFRKGADKMESREIRKKAYGNFESGLHCAEVISKTILEIFSEEPHPEVIRTASGFGGGIAGSTEELCGAFTGGIIALGALLGREKGGDDLRDCGSLTREFKKKFVDEFGSLNCQTLLDGFSEQGNPLGCVKLTANAAVILAELLNELGLKAGIDLNSFSVQPREKVALGHCPFSV